MKLLIITQIVDKNDPALGFFHRWLEEFAQHVERLEVVCLFENTHSLPENVRVHSLGKEENVGRVRYIIHFYRYIWRLRREYDAVFVHMNQLYVLLGWPVWFLCRKPVTLWYTHGSVPLSLRCATVFAQRIFTASAHGMRIDTPKRRIVGHGVDLDLFSPGKRKRTPPLTLSLSRIAPVKRLDLIIRACAALRESGTEFQMEIAGAPITETDREYLRLLESLIAESGLSNHVRLSGPIPNEAAAALLKETSAFVHASATGSMDKTVLEALASGVPVATTSAVFEHLIPVTKPEPEALARRIGELLLSPHPAEEVRALALGYSLERLIRRILKDIEELCAQ